MFNKALMFACGKTVQCGKAVLCGRVAIIASGQVVILAHG